MIKLVPIKSPANKDSIEALSIHSDLDDYCFVWTFKMLSEEEYESTEEVLDAARWTEAMLKAPTAEERVKAARALLKQHPDCGLPYLILARDGSSADRERNYQRAIELLTIEAEKTQGYEEAIDTAPEGDVHDEHFQSLLDWYDDTPYAFETAGVAYVVAELARIQWQDGRHDEAIACILSVLQRLQGRGFQLQSILVSYLIQLNREEQASSLLDQMPLSDPEWYYSKALLLFRKYGDNGISRSALREGLATNTAIAKVILSGDLLDTGDVLEDRLIHGLSELSAQDARIVVDMRAGWTTTSGAMEWLARTSNRVAPFSALQQMANPQFMTRFKLWRTNYEIADLQIERNNYKEAKKNARMAFKEVRKAGLVSNALFDSIEQLISIAEEYDGAFSEISQCVDELTTECRKSNDRDVEISVLTKLAECYHRLEKNDLAVALLDEVITVVGALCDKNEPAVCFEQLADALLKKGRSLNELERWEEAKPSLSRSLELQESYLSEAHPDLLLNLRLLSDCLAKLGEIEKSSELDNRIKAIRKALWGEDAEEL